MNDDVMKEISDVVRKNLPAHLSEELQKALKEGSEAVVALNGKQQYIERLETTQKELNDRLLKHGEINRREEVVAQREKAVAVAEQKLDLANQRVTAAEQRTHDLKEVVMAVFANNQYKYERNTSRSVNQYGDTGMNRGRSDDSTHETVRSEGTPP